MCEYLSDWFGFETTSLALVSIWENCTLLAANSGLGSGRSGHGLSSPPLPPAPKSHALGVNSPVLNPVRAVIIIFLSNSGVGSRWRHPSPVLSPPPLPLPTSDSLPAFGRLRRARCVRAHPRVGGRLRPVIERPRLRRRGASGPHGRGCVRPLQGRRGHRGGDQEGAEEGGAGGGGLGGVGRGCLVRGREVRCEV